MNAIRFIIALLYQDIPGTLQPPILTEICPPGELPEMSFRPGRQTFVAPLG
jgi:hypothetical protein